MTAEPRGLAPRVTLEQWAVKAEAAYGIARALVQTAFVPESLKLRDERSGALELDASTHQVAAALLTGEELGFPPMAALRAINIIPPGTGQPALTALALRAVLLREGHEIRVIESTDSRAVVRVRGRDDPEWQESRWTIDRAAKLKPRGFKHPESNWQKQPAAMLVARATAEGARWVAADAILACPYIAEETGDEAPEAEDNSKPARKSSGVTPLSRRRTTRRPVGVLAAGGAPPPAPVQTPPEPAGPPEEAKPAPMMTPAQRAALHAGMREIGIIGREASLRVINRWLTERWPGHAEIVSSNELTEAEASVCLGHINTERARQAAIAAQDTAGEPEGEPPTPTAPGPATGDEDAGEALFEEVPPPDDE